MAKSGSRERALHALLVASGHARAVPDRPASPHLARLPPELRESILEMFCELGGKGDFARTAPRGWDIPLAGGVLLELDEEQHFTPYRALTLRPPWARSLPWATCYEDHCVEHAAAAARNALHWTKPVPEHLFGPPGPHGAFDGPGSPRGKQRALLDAVRDAAAASGAVRLARIAVHDFVAGVRVGDALSGRAHLDSDALFELVRSRTTGP